MIASCLAFRKRKVLSGSQQNEGDRKQCGMAALYRAASMQIITGKWALKKERERTSCYAFHCNKGSDFKLQNCECGTSVLLRSLQRCLWVAQAIYSWNAFITL